MPTGRKQMHFRRKDLSAGIVHTRFGPSKGKGFAGGGTRAQNKRLQVWAGSSAGVEDAWSAVSSGCVSNWRRNCFSR